MLMKSYRHFCGRMRWANSAKRHRAARTHRGAAFFFISLYSSTCMRPRFDFISTLTQTQTVQHSVLKTFYVIHKTIKDQQNELNRNHVNTNNNTITITITCYLSSLVTLTASARFNSHKLNLT